jgi:hypothetical protein
MKIIILGLGNWIYHKSIKKSFVVMLFASQFLHCMEGFIYGLHVFLGSMGCVKKISKAWFILVKG